MSNIMPNVILAPQGGWGGGWAFGPHCGLLAPTVGLQPIPPTVLVYSGHFRRGPFLKFFRLDVCSIRYGCKHPSSPKVSGLHACVHVWRSVKIGMSIHETSMRNFYFHHHPQILHCFGALLIIETCVHIYAHCVHMRAPITTNFFCASLIPT